MVSFVQKNLTIMIFSLYLKLGLSYEAEIFTKMINKDCTTKLINHPQEIPKI